MQTGLSAPALPPGAMVIVKVAQNYQRVVNDLAVRCAFRTGVALETQMGKIWPSLRPARAYAHA